MAGARRNLLRTVEIYTNQTGMASFGVIADRALLFYQAKALLFEQANQFAKFIASDDSKASETTATLSRCIPSEFQVYRNL